MIATSPSCLTSITPVEPGAIVKKLKVYLAKKYVRSNFFIRRVVSPWNSLPEYVISAINSFKVRLDTHWSNQPMLYDFRASLDTQKNYVELNIMASTSVQYLSIYLFKCTFLWLIQTKEVIIKCNSYLFKFILQQNKWVI